MTAFPSSEACPCSLQVAESGKEGSPGVLPVPGEPFSVSFPRGPALATGPLGVGGGSIIGEASAAR